MCIFCSNFPLTCVRYLLLYLQTDVVVIACDDADVTKASLNNEPSETLVC